MFVNKMNRPLQVKPADTGSDKESKQGEGRGGNYFLFFINFN